MGDVIDGDFGGIKVGGNGGAPALGAAGGVLGSGIAADEDGGKAALELRVWSFGLSG